MGLLFTFITGLFFLLGIVLNQICKDKKNISVLAIALAFVVLINLIGLDLAPEVLSKISVWSLLCIFLNMWMMF